jgi:hypothetical protein
MRMCAVVLLEVMPRRDVVTLMVIVCSSGVEQCEHSTAKQASNLSVTSTARTIAHCLKLVTDLYDTVSASEHVCSRAFALLTFHQ